MAAGLDRSLEPRRLNEVIENMANGPLGYPDDIARHFLVFCDLVDRAEGYVRRGKYQEAAACAQIAASYAINRHAGLFVSPRLERVLAEIASRMLPESPVGTSGRFPEAPEHILHVFSLTAGIGGHTRMVWRWIHEDPSRRHSVAITHQGLLSVPAQLRESVATTGGALHVLDGRRGNLISWAADLRRIALPADLVVLHTNPDDIIPVIALAGTDQLPPVVLLNHADHVFWLGASVSTVVASQRESGLRLARDRRGIAPERSAMLPIIVEPRHRTMSRSEAKQQLGLPSDAVVLLSVARPHKFKRTALPDPLKEDLFLPDAVLPVLREHPHAVLLAVGAEPDAAWDRAAREANGRVRALGVRDETSVYYQAADVYLDSYPITSITSLLEAGSYDVPLVTCNPYPEEAGVLGSDTPGLGQHVERVRNADEYTSTLSSLIRSPEIRAAAGRNVRDDILAVHTGAGWKRYLDEVCRNAGSLHRPEVCYFHDDELRTTGLDVLLLALFHSQPDIDEISMHNLRNMPASQRVNEWARLRRSTGSRPGLLLPEWLGIRLEKWRQSRGRIGSGMRNGPKP